MRSEVADEFTIYLKWGLKKFIQYMGYFRILFVLHIILTFVISNLFNYYTSVSSIDKEIALLFSLLCEYGFWVVTGCQVFFTYFNAHIYPHYINRIIGFSFDKKDEERFVIDQVEWLALRSGLYALANLGTFFVFFKILKCYEYALIYSILMVLLYVLIIVVEFYYLKSVSIEMKILVSFRLKLDRVGWRDEKLYEDYLMPYAKRQFNLRRRENETCAYIAAYMIYLLMNNYTANTYQGVEIETDLDFFKHLYKFALSVDKNKPNLRSFSTAYLDDIIRDLEIMLYSKLHRIRKITKQIKLDTNHIIKIRDSDISSSINTMINEKFLKGYSALILYRIRHSVNIDDIDDYENQFVSRIIVRLLRTGHNRFSFPSEKVFSRKDLKRHTWLLSHCLDDSQDVLSIDFLIDIDEQYRVFLREVSYLYTRCEEDNLMFQTVIKALHQINS
jgi:hypothetical protein